MGAKNENKKLSEQFVQDWVADNYESLRYKLPYSSAYHQWWLQEMIGLSSLTAGSEEKYILDNGCGTGLLLNEFQQMGNVFGLDLSFGMLGKAYSMSNRLVQGDSYQLPFANNQFDIIFARALIHHLPDPEEGLKEMYRVLKPHGQVILADTNYSWLSALPRKIAYRRENFAEHHANLNHTAYLDSIGRFFVIEKLQFFGYLAYPFGFPDMMGRLRDVPYPVALVRFLLKVDGLISRMPIIHRQSWGIMVAARKAE